MSNYQRLNTNFSIKDAIEETEGINEEPSVQESDDPTAWRAETNEDLLPESGEIPYIIKQNSKEQL